MLRKVQCSGHGMLKHSAGQTLRSTGMQSRPAAALALPCPPAILQLSMQSLLRPQRALLRVNRQRPAPLLCRSMWHRRALESLPRHPLETSPSSCSAYAYRIVKAAGFSAPARLSGPRTGQGQRASKAQAGLPGQARVCLPEHMLDPALEQYYHFSWHYMRLLFMESPSSAFVRQG